MFFGQVIRLTISKENNVKLGAKVTSVKSSSASKLLPFL